MKRKNNNELNVNGTIVRVIRHNGADYVCDVLADCQEKGIVY